MPFSRPRRFVARNLLWPSLLPLVFATHVLVAQGSTSSPAPGGQGGLALERLWKQELGPGYSGIAATEDVLVTMFSDGQEDWIVALVAATGQERWRRSLGPTFLGSGGSENGPGSTPVLAGDTVFALGPRGTLLALRLDDGALIWSVQIDEVAQAPAPIWGFVTTPVVEGELVIVQTGGPEPFAVVAFDRTTGALRWSSGGDPMGYQSPAVMTLAGLRQIVVIANETLSGLVPDTGELLWSYPYGQPDYQGASRALQVSADSFLLTANSNGSGWSDPTSLYRLRNDAGTLELEKVWTSPFLKNSYAVPVVLDGHVYGFNGGFLSCVDLQTGELVWRSRPPGGKDLTRLESTLLVLSPGGDLVAVAATPEGYRESARVPALDTGGFAPPAVAAGRVFVRDSREIAAFEATDRILGATEEARAAARGDFATFLAQLEESADKSGLVDDFLARQRSFPIVEDDGLVHFIYRGPAQDVALIGTMTDLFAPDRLLRVNGTDLFHRSYRFEPATRWEYFFEVDFDGDTAVADPLNPQRIQFSWGEMSELRMPGWEEADHLAELPTPRGTVEAFSFSSTNLGADREVRVYLPPGYSESSTSYPLLVVNGLGHLERGRMDRTLDHLIGDTVQPVVVAFVAETERPLWYDEYVGDLGDELATALATELVPLLERRYRLMSDADSRAILGAHETAQTALYAALLHPEVFSAVAVQAIRLLPPVRDAVLALIAEQEGVGKRYYVDWNRLDYRDSFYNIDYPSHSREVYTALREAEYALEGGEVPGGGGWRSVAARNDRVLAALFPLSPDR